MPFMAHVAMSKLWCGLQVNMWLIQGFLFVYVILTEMELFFILVMAFLRTIAVWSPQRHQVKQRTSLALVMGVALYSIAITSALMVPYWVDIVDESTAIIIARVLSVTHYFLPVLLTLACYSSMIFVIRRNKCRLAATPDTAETGQVMDQATRAMLAVFISNLLFGLPHSIYHILSYPGHVVPYVSIHIVFYSHLFIDPLVFVCFNLHHRQRLLQALKSCLQRVICCPFSALRRATSTLPLHFTSSSSSSSSQKNHS
ncbi:rhodopsin-like isoform X1 [Portunus trituberculatus]|uniref:rhodopsin-like isoform X1 n=1 Tax=Portunus trituberculatus TaxID=210409 RepID=UPI001E1CC961|nr:rhodopsin-like isoform X1 [Portunus trituberculatus]